MKDILEYGNNNLKKWDGLHYLEYQDEPIMSPCKIKIIGMGKAGSEKWMNNYLNNNNKTAQKPKTPSEKVNKKDNR